MTNICGGPTSDNLSKMVDYEDIRDAILSLEVMPSMRAMMTAGKAAERDNTCIYNCAYLPVDDPKSFDEAMFILLCGTGVGFSVERQYISKLPEVPDTLYDSDTTVVVKDSKEGWAKSYRQVLSLLWAGEIPKWDVSKVRSAGAKLKTFGGRASGPAPLEDLFRFTIDKFQAAVGRKLNSVEVHDILCKIGEIVVVGGVRRSAMISLSNLSDDRMRHAKSGQWYLTEGQRALANNSVAYTEKPDVETFIREWTALIESKSGERGIFNRVASQKQAAKNDRRKVYEDDLVGFDKERNPWRTEDSKSKLYEFGTNPCSEIILRPYQFCNLTEVVVRATDTLEDLERKVRLATILGTIQSTYTKFPYLRKIWQKNTEEERLLGVSLTGIMDNPLMTSANKGLDKTLEHLRSVAVSTNAEWASRLDIPVSTAITCVKPSGTVSQLVDSASGIHTRHSEYYIRTQKAPEKAVTRHDISAVEQLETWLTYQRHWCEHKPSVTVSVKDDEWLDVGAFVYKHFDEMSGVSFLPYDGGTYQQAPYQECDKERYEEVLSQMPESIDWSELAEYEAEDNTAGMQTMACSGDTCEIVDLT
jgi:ribonucleoside-diphosphate reductase alpha chain